MSLSPKPNSPVHAEAVIVRQLTLVSMDNASVAKAVVKTSCQNLNVGDIQWSRRRPAIGIYLSKKTK
jgi:hypothetical protein